MKNRRVYYPLNPVLIILLSLVACQKIVEIPQTATVNFIIGEVNIDGQPAKIGEIVNNGSIITTGVNSVAEIKFGKHSGTQIRENSRVKVKLDQEKWDVIAYQGAVLNVIEPGSNFKLRGPSSVIAIRGTIFYVHSYDDSTQYICTCNGIIDIEDNQQVNKTVAASHHEGYNVVKSDTGQTFTSESMKEHSDLEIFEFMYRIEHGSDPE
ncbi:MAG: FecR domain-containing protein [Calditrichaceae bacterium]|jgi:hypothetical protein